MENVRRFESCLLLGALCMAGCSSEDSPTTFGTAGSAGREAAENGGSNTAGSSGMSASGGVGGSAGTGAAGTTTGTGGVATGGVGGSAGTGGSKGGSPGTGGSTGGAGTGGMSGAGGTTTGTGGGATGGASGEGCGKPAGLMSGRASIDVNGVMREYILHVPDDYDPNRPYKLIFGWHPLGSSAEFIANRGYYGLEEPSAGQAIFVAPDGLVQDGDQGWWNTDGQDVDFYFAMLDRFRSGLCIDQDRIFSTGFSFGAMFSFTLACTPDSMTRAIAPAAGNAARGCGDSTPPVAVMAFIGVNDSLLSGHRRAVTNMVGVNGCSETPTEMSMSWCDGLNSNNLPCVCVEYQNCNEGYPVISCEYLAGHTFAPNAGQTTWDFFARF